MTKLITAIIIIGFMVVLSHRAVAQQSTACNQPIKDVSETDFVPMQVYRTLAVRRVAGYAVDPNDVRMPTVCIGVFSPTDKRLVASAVADNDGRFQLPAIPPGKYRLVARAGGFCIAIVPLKIVSWPGGGMLKRRHLVLHMRLSALDVCSYGGYR